MESRMSVPPDRLQPRARISQFDFKQRKRVVRWMSEFDLVQARAITPDLRRQSRSLGCHLVQLDR